MLAAIQLEEYYIKKIDYKYDPQLEKDNNDTDLKFGHTIKYKSKKVEVTITCKVSSNDSKLRINVILVGIFDVNFSEDESPSTRKFICERNTLTILFPYLRSAVSDISLKANIKPIILPTVNIVSLLDEAKESKKNQNKSK